MEIGNNRIPLAFIMLGVDIGNLDKATKISATAVSDR